MLKSFHFNTRKFHIDSLLHIYFFSPPLPGFLIQITGSFATAFLFIGGCLVVGGLLLLVLPLLTRHSTYDTCSTEIITADPAERRDSIESGNPSESGDHVAGGDPVEGGEPAERKLNIQGEE